MAVNMISSGFLLLVLIAGVQSAIKELGETCASTDSCVNPLVKLVCDTPPMKTTGVCRVKEGQVCKNAGGLCVVGAECTVSGSTDTCNCKTGYTLNPTSHQCTPPDGGYYDTCATSTTDCTLTGVDNAASACTTDGGCKCATATPVPMYADGTCVVLGNAMVGKTCTGAGDTTTCGTNSATHMSCVDTKCACDTAYFPTKTPGGTCVANTASTVGKTCTPAKTNPSDCTGVNEECATGATKCTCKAGHTYLPGGVCFPVKGTLKGGCTVDADCGSGLKCTSVSSNPKTCKTVLAAGAACTANPDTSLCGDGLVCDSTCKTEVDVGDDCTDTANKKCKLHTTCGTTSHKCEVDATYIGGSCTATNAFEKGTCQINTLCGAVTSGICVCPSGYKADPAEDCAIIAHMYGAPCTATTANTKGDCGDDSLVCSGTTSGTCGCATTTGYTGGSVGGVCSKPPSANSLGGACTASSCTDPNAECSGSVCRCTTEYVKSYFTGQCVIKAGSTTVCTGLTCVEGSTCDATSHRCQCDTGMAPNANGLCLPTTAGVLGGPCTITTTASTAQGTCTADNSKCASGMCTCEDDYTATALAGSCRSNDAMMITTSSLLITLAAVISQQFVR